MGRTARNKAFDFGVPVFRPEHRADANQRQPHLNVEIFKVRLAQVLRMRVVSLGERIQIKFHLLFAIFLVDVPRDSIVAAADQLRPGLDRVLAQLFLQQFTRDAAVPQLIGLRFIFWPRRFFPAQLHGRVGFEIHRLFEQLFDLADSLVDSLLVEVVNLVSRLEIPEQNIVGQRGAVFCGQRVDIFLSEEEMAEIEQLEVIAQKFLRHLGVQLLMGVMALFEKATN